jgi:hypothetical protein
MQHIADVPKGKSCQCICPGCDTLLIARKGQINKWHFSHSVAVECNGETALHKAAKQILVEEANLNNEIQLPANQKFIIAEKDCLGFSHSITVGDNEKEFFLMLEGQDEVKICGDIQTDVLLTGEGDQTLSVEIYVTHKKNEDDHHKYSKIRQNSIEIDLSMLSWDADYEAIKRAVLWYAPREWVYSEEIKNKMENSRNDLQVIISEQNNRYYKEFSDFVFSINSTEEFKKIEIPWPEITAITGYADQTFSYSPQINSHIEKQVVKIEKIDADWKKFQDTACFRCKAIVGNNTIVDLLMCLESVNLKINIDTPVLVCFVGYKSIDSAINVMDSKWLNIDKWEDKLHALAEEKLKIKINTIEQSHKDTRQFASKFLGFSNDEKMSYLAKKLDIPSPKDYGKESRYWNTREIIWKSLIRLYRFQNSKRDKINIPQLARDKWFEALTGWPNDEESVKKRNIDLWYWFKELETEGLVHHTGRQWFSIDLSQIKVSDRDYYSSESIVRASANDRELLLNSNQIEKIERRIQQIQLEEEQKRRHDAHLDYQAQAIAKERAASQKAYEVSPKREDIFIMPEFVTCSICGQYTKEWVCMNPDICKDCVGKQRP